MADVANRYLRLVKVRTKLMHKWTNEKDPRKRVELQAFIAAVDNMLDLMTEKVLDQCMLQILLDMLETPDTKPPQRTRFEMN